LILVSAQPVAKIFTVSELIYRETEKKNRLQHHFIK